MPADLAVTEPLSLSIGGMRVPLRTRVNRRARRLILRIAHHTGEVVVVAPSRRELKDALAFADAQRGWIAEQLRAVPRKVAFAPGVHIPVNGRRHIIEHQPRARRGVFCNNDLFEGAKICVSGEAAHLPRRVEDFLKREARRLLAQRTEAHCRKLDLKPPRIVLRDPATRWGSCSRTRGISYSWRLVMAPPFVLDYVAAHEVAHLVHMDHSRAFWRLLSMLVPDMRRAMDWLASEGRSLHAIGR